MAKNKEIEVETSKAPRPVVEIINELLMELTNHPDAQLGNCALHGPCPQGLVFKDTPRGQCHLTELRIVYRDPLLVPETQEKKPWKWQGVVDSANAAPAPVPEEKPNPRWAHLVPAGKQEPVEAGA